MVENIQRNLKFLLKFLGVFFVLYLIVNLFSIEFLQDSIALYLANFLHAAYSSHYVFINDHVFEIAPDCTGVISTIMLASILIALKKPTVKQKLLLLLLGILLIFPLNFLRLVFVLGVAKIAFELSNIAHAVSWFLMGFFVVSLWFFIIERVYKIKVDESFF